MVTVDKLLERYRSSELSERDKGTKFERLMKNFLRTYPAYRGKFSDVWLWNEFPFRDELGTVDLGIDIVAKTVDGDFWAVQCKFYADTTPISKAAVDTFIATSGRTFGGKNFSARLWIATSDNLTDHAEETLQNQTPPVLRLTLEDLRNAEVDWQKLDAGIFGDEAVTKNFLRDYQLAAINAAHEHFKQHDRGQLIMACGTGKTFTALKIAERQTDSRGLILFLVPSITLIKQTLVEWARNADKPFNAICVCSDETAAKKDEDAILDVNLPLPPTTDPKKISAALQLPRRDGMTVIFSTYQSLDKVAAAQKFFGKDFDLIICDEAHRTTGSSKDDATQFTAVHDENFIHGRKRMYMTATPRMFTSDAKTKATINDIMLWSMDDQNIYGREFYRLNFSDAVEKNLLTDYKVIVLTVNEKISDDKKSGEDRNKIKGCINALSKKMIAYSEQLAEVDPVPMKTAVTFCPKITASKIIAEAFNKANDEEKFFTVEARHVDGKQSSIVREKNLSWLKEPTTDANTCKILTNVRCLSEGVDVPALDAVIFMSSKKSRVEIVQAVGRVMRKATGKKYGYIIIPVVVPLEKNPEDVLSASKTYDVIWDILNALRAHDSRIDIFIEEIKLKQASGTKPNTPRIVIAGGEDPVQLQLNFGKWQDFLYARMVERVGNRKYWEQWAQDIAAIVERHTQQITDLISVAGDHQRKFGNFVHDLQQNLNAAVTTKDAVEMLAQHMVTRPVFEALFENYSFARNNPVSQSLEKILAQLDIKETAAESEQMQKFYQSVRERCKAATTAEERQAIIIELYEKFFRMAVPKTVERLGIVYTPVEVVDFILRSVDAVLKKNFGRGITDKNVHVLEPFAGTGTFLVRLIQSNLIRKRDLLRKYFRELHANEIVLLAYYIAAINIENAFNATGDDYQPFEGICFTDTFQAYEQDDNARGQIVDKTFRDSLKENSERVNEQNRTRIEVIVGNPPYSVGQRSANDNNRNVFYSRLEARISATYAATTDATNKNSLYDSYIKAFRWASDRIVDGGVIGFVTNAGWLDGAAMDGLRKCFAKEFSAIYVFNLRGNARTQGELRQREKDNVFGQGSRAPIAITILVKNSEHDGDAEIFYRDIGDYLSRDEKLKIIRNTNNVLDESFAPITPNDRGDWINQRGDTFDTFIILGDKKNPDNEQTFFCRYYTNGVKTQRDPWCYNFSRPALESNMRTTIDYYNTHEPTDFDSTKITWTRATVQNKNRGREYKFNAAQIVESMYRPFCKTNFYYDLRLNEMTYQVPKLFPTGHEDNLLICVNGFGGDKLSALITDKIADLHFNGDAQCFPLYWYEHDAQGSLFGEGYHRRDGVSDFILRRAQLLFDDVSKEDVFYYVYGFLHLPGYREKFSAELKKSLPRIFLVDDAKKFWQLSKAGRALAEIHLHYESQPPAQVEVIGTERGAFAVKKMRLSSDKTTLTYNDFITIRDIPPRSFDYVVNGRSPLEWIIDRYQVKTDSASGIVNDPNAWGIEHDNPRYIVDLILSAITVSLKTLDIVDSLPAIDFGD